MVELRERMTGVLAEATGKDRATIVADIDRDKILRGDDAVEYGLVDQVLHKVTPRSVLAEAS
jgi:ATP-dependent Clp protease protease subunit